MSACLPSLASVGVTVPVLYRRASRTWFRSSRTYNEHSILTSACTKITGRMRLQPESILCVKMEEHLHKLIMHTSHLEVAAQLPYLRSQLLQRNVVRTCAHARQARRKVQARHSVLLCLLQHNLAVRDGHNLLDNLCAHVAAIICTKHVAYKVSDRPSKYFTGDHMQVMCVDASSRMGWQSKSMNDSVTLCTPAASFIENKHIPCRVAAALVLSAVASFAFKSSDKCLYASIPGTSSFAPGPASPVAAPLTRTNVRSPVAGAPGSEMSSVRLPPPRERFILEARWMSAEKNCRRCAAAAETSMPFSSTKLPSSSPAQG